MINTSKVDLLTLIERDTELKRIASTNGGEWHGPCPFCGGKDRFAVQPYAAEGGRWMCRQCSQHWQDAVAYVMLRQGVGFKEACRILELPLDRQPGRQQRTERHAAPSRLSAQKDWIALHDEAWQAGARTLSEEAVAKLWKSHEALNYLHSRGLTDDVIAEHQLGFLLREIRMQWGSTLVWLPRGIVIPWLIDGKYWSLRVRRLDHGSPKYLPPRGAANGLYRGDQITYDGTVILVEGEIDALSVLVGTKRDVVPVATGSATQARTMDAFGRLLQADRVLLAFDTDTAGEEAAAFWQGLLGDRAIRLRPLNHDVNDMLRLGDDLDGWIESALVRQPASV